MNFKIPSPLQKEHEQLHAKLVEATKVNNGTGNQDTTG